MLLRPSGLPGAFPDPGLLYQDTLAFQVKMEDIDAQMLTLKQQGAAARGYKGQLTKVTKRLESAKE